MEGLGATPQTLFTWCWGPGDGQGLGRGTKGRRFEYVIGGLIMVFLELLFLMSEKESAEVENMTESRILGARVSAEVHSWFCNSKKCGHNLVFINRTRAL